MTLLLRRQQWRQLLARIDDGVGEGEEASRVGSVEAEPRRMDGELGDEEGDGYGS